MGPSVGSQSDICDVIKLAGRNIMFSVIPLLYHLGLIDEVNSAQTISLFRLIALNIRWILFFIALRIQMLKQGPKTC